MNWKREKSIIIIKKLIDLEKSRRKGIKMKWMNLIIKFKHQHKLWKL